MSLDDLKALAATDTTLAARLAAVQSLSELEAIANEVGIAVDVSEFEDEEVSLQELSSASGGIGMLLSSKLGFGTLSNSASNTDGCATWDLDKCTVSTKKGESPSCG